MSQALLHRVAVKLLERIEHRRKTCSHDLVAESLDEIVDAIAGACAEDIGDDPNIRDLIDSHLRAHKDDYEPRRPLDAPPVVLGSSTEANGAR